MIRAIGGLKEGFSDIGDDLALCDLNGVKLAAKVDMLVWSTDVPKGMKLWQVSRKAVAMCVSDFAAKGVRPMACLVSLGLPRGMREEEVEELASGFGRAKEEFDVEIVGGDTNESKELVIDCAMFGLSEGMVPRGGARVGDRVMVSGPFGYTSAGLKMIMEGMEAEPRFRDRALRSVFMPEPRLELGITLAGKRLMNSSIDSSDGLAISLWELADKGGVGIELETLPVGEGVLEFSEMNGLDWEELVLYGGEEYEIVFTVSEDRVEEAKGLARELGVELIEIGRVVEGGGVKYRKRGRLEPVKRDGWIHLK